MKKKVLSEVAYTQPNLKSLNRVVVSMLAITLFLFVGCKKDKTSAQLSDKQKIQNAKEWFSDKQKNSKSTLSSSKGSAIALTFEPDWEHANFETINGKEVITTTVETNLKKISGRDSRYYLVILDNGREYTSKTISFKNLAKEITFTPKELYTTAFTNESISPENSLNADIKVFTQGFNEEKHFLYTASGKTDLAINKPESGKPNFSSQDKTSVIWETCTYYYITTNVYDAQGNLFWTSGRQLTEVECTYTDRETIDHLDPNPNDNGTPGGSTDSLDITESITMGENINTPYSMTTVSETDTETGYKIKEVEVAWKFFQNNSANTQFKSLEKAKITRSWVPFSSWAIIDMNHITSTSIGLAPENVTCDVSILNTSVTLSDYQGEADIFTDPSGETDTFGKAKMRLTFQETYTWVNVRGKTRVNKSALLYNERTWTANDIAGMP